MELGTHARPAGAGPVAAGTPGGRRRQGLIVVGMHRSGTSALTRVLSLLGAALPKTLMQAHPGVNETGFWEPLRIVALHDELLRSIDSRWDDVLPVSPSWFASAAARTSRDRLVEMMREEFGDSPLFVLKDPRVCRLLPLWLEVLDDLGVEPLFVHMVRNPLEVAQSLQTRDAFPQVKSLLLWLGHLLGAEHATRGRLRAFVRYEDLLQDPLGTAERLGRDLAVVWPRETHLAKAEIEQFLLRRHRHHVIPDEAVIGNRSVSAWVGAAAALLAPTVTEREREPGFDALHARYLEGSEEYGRLVALLERDVRHERGRREALEAQVSTLQADATAQAAAQSALAARLAQLQHELEQRDARILKLRSLAQRAGGPVRWLRALRDLPLVWRSGLFDAGYYRATYPDVREIPLPALLHFLHFGARENRDPQPLFSASWYRQTYPEVADAGEHPLVHYLRRGAAEGFDPHPDFSTRFYLDRYPDVRASGLNPLAHYLRYGRPEGRLPRDPDAAAAPAAIHEAAAGQRGEAVGKSEHFFPNQPPETMALEALFRQHVAPLPEPSRLALYEVLTALHPDLAQTRFEIADEYILAHQAGRVIAFPRPLPLIKYAHLSCGYETWLEHKYALPGFVEVEPGDVVIDCGAYVGGFSLSAVKKAQAVHLFEPDAANFRCIERNFAGVGNAVLNRRGLYNTDSEMLLNVSASSVEHSFLQPDDGQVVRQEAVRVSRVDTYCRERGIAALSFLKIEAEGVELEVFAGLGDLRPRKLAIDVSPERDGESPAPQFVERLTALGYELQQRGHVLFARR